MKTDIFFIILETNLTMKAVIEKDDDITVIRLEYDDGTIKFTLEPENPDDFIFSYPTGEYGAEESNGQFKIKWDFIEKTFHVNVAKTGNGYGGYINLVLNLTDEQVNSIIIALTAWRDAINYDPELNADDYDDMPDLIEITNYCVSCGEKYQCDDCKVTTDYCNNCEYYGYPCLNCADVMDDVPPCSICGNEDGNPCCPTDR